ncbi:MAG: 4a-hydroxytetrahydrobiopterin dehydratase [Nitrospiraceae bacterium]|nr:4a-hydroxytetrahydrobiopterin dehydratase [Nitrospiraceae bacterium]|tara:strand:+ start:1036 stop:1401 length:366 start_codon:yes stop_codon:yes gene_type:complete
MSLADNKCIPCRGGVPPLTESQAMNLLGQLDSSWELTNSATHLQRSYLFKNFVHAMDFANKLADVAEEEGHHPELHIGWGKCTVDLWTHKINGLTESDFFLAAKSDRVLEIVRSATEGIQP